MAREQKNFSLKKAPGLRSPLSSKLFNEIREEILGKSYELSLVFANRKESQKINRKYRKKNKPANVLSFPLEKKSGEIVIDLETTKKEYLSFYKSYKKYILYLFIHGCLHLKGLSHGSRMNKEEDKFMAKFSS